MLEDVARQCDEFSDMFHTRDAKNGVTSFGKRRGGRNAVYDWRRKMNASDRRVEFKSSCFLWDKRCQRWFLSFHNVKTLKFDDLVLGVYAPWGLELWEYKASAYVGLPAWSQIRGGEIRFYGSVQILNVVEAWQSTILPKLAAVASHRISLSWDHWLVRKYMVCNAMEMLYRGVPFFQRSPACRNRFLSEVVRRFVQQDYKRHQFRTQIANGDASTDDGISACSCRKGQLKVKTAMLSWHTGRLCWFLRFREVQHHSSDMLFLVAYLPWGLDIWESSTLSTTTPKSIYFYGQPRETCPNNSFASQICPKLSATASHVALLMWRDTIIQEALCTLGDG